MPEQPVLPDGKESFKLNEVCKLASVQPYMLRFWGTEFPRLEAGKSGTGQRNYTRKQVELILEIRLLLFDEGLTIAGARKRIEKATDAVVAKKPKGSKTSKKAAPPANTDTAAPPTQNKEVDKIAAEIVQPLIATLRDVREEIVGALADLRTE